MNSPDVGCVAKKSCAHVCLLLLHIFWRSHRNEANLLSLSRVWTLTCISAHLTRSSAVYDPPDKKKLTGHWLATFYCQLPVEEANDGTMFEQNGALSMTVLDLGALG